MLNVMTGKQAAARLINDGDTVSINGFGSVSHPDDIDKAIEELFLETGRPRDLTLVFSSGQGQNKKGAYVDRLGHEGLVKRVIAGHYALMPQIRVMVSQNKIQAYNLPQGVICHLFRACASKKPGILTRVGLHTFVDPRLGGGRLNELSQETWVELMELDGEKYLYYKTPQINVAIVRGTTADPGGNITAEKECLVVDALHIAQAARANRGKVIVQVERLSTVPANPHDVIIPGILVDAVVLAPDQKQTISETYNPAYCGEIRVPHEHIKKVMNDIRDWDRRAGIARERGVACMIIGRRAALELKPGNVINLGVGMPELVSLAAQERGLIDDLIFTVEPGVIGGVPSVGGSFGASFNPDMIYSQASQFDFYDGCGLDIAYMGAMEVDEKGNVNVSRLGDKVVGVGGFINITQSAKKVVYCLPFMGGGLDVQFDNGCLRIVKEGLIEKFSSAVQQVSFSGSYAAQMQQPVLYVTERCVFRLSPEGLELIEIAPGIDVQMDILGKLSFCPIISDHLKMMDMSCFIDPWTRNTNI